MDNNIGDRIKKKRKAMNMTQQEVASYLNINNVTYHGYEANKHEPNLNTLVKLADLFETSTDYILGRYEGKD